MRSREKHQYHQHRHPQRVHRVTKRRVSAIVCMVLAMGAVSLASFAATSRTLVGTDFNLRAGAVTSGGGFSAGSGFELYGATGQVGAGPLMSGGDFSLAGGLIGPTQDASIPCPGDANGDGVVNVQDLLDVISNWGSDGSEGGDVNDDGIVNVQDLLEVISNWGSTCD